MKLALSSPQNEYRIHLAHIARLQAMAQPQMDWLHPGQQWEIACGRAYDLRYLIKFVIDLIGDDYVDWITQVVMNPTAVGTLIREPFANYVRSLEVKLSNSDVADDFAACLPASARKDDFTALVNTVLTGEGAYGFSLAINQDCNDFEARLARVLSKVKDEAVSEVEIPDDDEEVLVQFFGLTYVVPKVATVVKDKQTNKFGYTLWSNKQVGHTINWLIHNNQMDAVRELVVQFPLLEHGRNKFMHECERHWASNTVLHIPAMGSLRMCPNIVLDSKSHILRGRIPKELVKLVPIRQIEYPEHKMKGHESLYERAYGKRYPHVLKSLPLEEIVTDGGTRIITVQEQWARLLPGIGETNASWLKHGKYVAGEVLDGCHPAPGKISKRTKLFTGATFWALIPENITVKLIGDTKYREKFERMAATEGIKLTEDDFSTVITESEPFDAKGGIYVSKWLADHLFVMYKDSTFHRLSDGDKFTRLVGRWCVKGLVHIREDLDADIVLGEDCIKFFANEEFARGNRNRFVVADIAADYLNVGMRKVSTQVAMHYPSYSAEMITNNIIRYNIAELVAGKAPVEAILKVLSFKDAKGNVKLDPAGEMVKAGIPILYQGIYGRADHNWWDYLRRWIQRCIDLRVKGIGGKLVVAPSDLLVDGWIGYDFVKNVELPANAISVPFDAYTQIRAEMPPWWLRKHNNTLIGAQSSFPFTGRHGMVKVDIWAHNPRHRCVYVGSDLLDLVERDCDGDPEAAIVDPGFVTRCAVSYEYARKVRDEVAHRTEQAIKLGKEIATGKSRGKLLYPDADGGHFWVKMPEYPYLSEQRTQRAADCIKLASIDHMGLADNAVRRAKMLGTDLALYDEHDREGTVQFRRDVELGALFQALSQIAVAEKEGQPVVAIPTASQMEVLVGHWGVEFSFPNINPYLRNFGITKTDIPDAEYLMGPAPVHFGAVNRKRDKYGDMLPSFRGKKYNERKGKAYPFLTAINTVDAFRKETAFCFDMTEAAMEKGKPIDPYALAMALFHGHLELSTPLTVDDMGKAITNALTKLYSKEVAPKQKGLAKDEAKPASFCLLTRDDWFATKWVNHHTKKVSKPVNVHELWWKQIWMAFHDCPACGEPLYPEHPCKCKACRKPLYATQKARCRCDVTVPYQERMSLNRTRYWDECSKRLDHLFSTAVVGFGDNYNITRIWKEGEVVHTQYSWGKPPDSIVTHLKRRVLITCLFGDYSKDTNGQMLGYGNLLMIARHLDEELFKQIMIEWHQTTGIPVPDGITEDSPLVAPDDARVNEIIAQD